MANTKRFKVSRADSRILLAELTHVPAVLYAALQEQLLTAAAKLDAEPEQPTDIRLAEEHAEAFREWLDRATVREAQAQFPRRAEVFARVRDSEH
jgi:hypothetical protein